MDAKIDQLKKWVAESDNIVFFGGAGVSTESGYRISAALTACIISSGSTRRRRF